MRQDTYLIFCVGGTEGASQPHWYSLHNNATLLKNRKTTTTGILQMKVKAKRWKQSIRALSTLFYGKPGIIFIYRTMLPLYDSYKPLKLFIIKNAIFTQHNIITTVGMVNQSDDLRE